MFVGKEDFKFNAAHFVAFEGYRERLHGHNYAVSVRLTGRVCRDGYVVDFGDVKKYTRGICKELNEHFICPTASDVLQITSKDEQVVIECPDGAYFSFPRGVTILVCARLELWPSSLTICGLASFAPPRLRPYWWPRTAYPLPSRR